MLTVCSFWVLRPDEYPHAADYPSMLKILQRSCDRLGVRHVVLTDDITAGSDVWPDGVEPFAFHGLPGPLMQACTEAHARLLEAPPAGNDILFVGADSILLEHPDKHLVNSSELFLTSRKPNNLLDAINNGFMLVRAGAMDRAAALYRRVADRCGTRWRDDQRALVEELSPVPIKETVCERANLAVHFLPMQRFNQSPIWPYDPCKGAILLHFKGKAGKRMMPLWAKKQGFA